MNNRCITLHSNNGSQEWFIDSGRIAAVRIITGQPDPASNGVWVYLAGDPSAIKVDETREEVLNAVLG